MTACNHGPHWPDQPVQPVTLTVQASGDGHLSITPNSVQQAAPGSTLSFTVVAASGYTIASTVGGTCTAGSWNGSVYTTGALENDCAVNFSSTPNVVTETFTVQSSGDGHVTITPSSAQTVNAGAALSFTVVADANYTVSLSVGGTCPGGSWAGNQYTTGAITAACAVSFSATFNTTTLNVSLSNLALSVSGLTWQGNPSGKARAIVITNTGAHAATGLAINYPTFPAGTSASSTCGAILNPGSSCSITVTPGATATSDCSIGTGSAAIPDVINVGADNGNSVSTNVVVLNYGCIYQEGYVFSMDDTTPSTSSIGGTVAALQDQATNMLWGSNGQDANSVSYDIIPGIGDTSTSSSGTPTFQDFVTYFQATYTGSLGLSANNFNNCNGRTDGRCNTANIVTFYNYYQTNYGVGAAPYTPSAAATSKAYYPAGVCDDYDSGNYRDWYLPAVCEVTHDDTSIRTDVAGCGTQSNPLMQNIEQNLFERGAGNIATGTHFWSSTEYMYNSPETYAWNGFMWPAFFPAGGGDKNDRINVRCVRSLTF